MHYALQMGIKFLCTHFNNPIKQGSIFFHYVYSFMILFNVHTYTDDCSSIGFLFYNAEIFF